MVDYESAFRKPFTDAKKLLIGILLGMLPVVNWFSKGFVLECSGLGKNKPSKKMPAWKDFGDLFFKGFLAAAISMVYMLPAAIIFIFSGFYIVLAVLRHFIGSIIPIELLEKAATDSAAQDAVARIVESNWAAVIPLILKFVPIMVLGAVLVLIAFYLIPAATLAFLDKKRFTAAFNLPLVFKKAFTVHYFLVILVLMGIWMIGAMITRFLPIIGGAILFFISGVIGYSLLGEAYKKAK